RETGASGTEPSVTISCSVPPPNEKRNSRTLALSTALITRLPPLGSAVTPSPARIGAGSPPVDGSDQVFPPAEKYSVLPSGEEAIDGISPLPGVILRVMRPVEVSATAMAACGAGPIMNAIPLAPAADIGSEVSSVV